VGVLSLTTIELLFICMREQRVSDSVVRPRRIDQLTAMPLAAVGGGPVNAGAVRSVQAVLPSGALLGHLADLFAGLGDPTRLRIVAALSSRELCVRDLALAIGQTTSAVSHQLRQLRRLGLVQGRRDGRRVYYSLDDRHVGRLYGEALDHVRHRTEGRQ
jgi:ArsR family transcriptional regulator, lead/cadmium/zinc/bismuth-responsive transcriptional repressor